VAVAVAGIEVAAGGADAVVELEEDWVGELDVEPHAASETAASPASNGTKLRILMALYS
jgi:hypothetical protein